MKTYKEFIAEVSGASFGASIRPGRGFSVGGGVSGGNNTKQYKAGIRYDQNKVSGQGDKIGSGITQAIQTPGTSASTSSAPTTQRSVSVGGSLQMRSEPNPQPGGGNNPKQKPEERVKRKPKPERPERPKRPDRPERPKRPERPDRPDRPERPEPVSRSKEPRLDKRGLPFGAKNKYKTTYRYAVPTGTGGRFNTRQASGANQMTDFKAIKTNRTGGTNYQRTKVVGDPSGPGGTGNTVSAKRYDKLFGNGGKYAPKGDGSSKYVPDKLGKPFNSKGYQPNKFVP